MNILYSYQDILLYNMSFTRYRYLYSQIDWSQRMISISGARGVGKTTMILQHLNDTFGQTNQKVLYATLEHPYFYHNTLFDLLTQFYEMGGRHIFLDEVHKYPNWAKEIKVAYDGYRDLQIVFTSSSALELDRGSADLSRRLSRYQLAGLSFREYLAFHNIGSWGKIPIPEITQNARSFVMKIASEVSILPHFKDYLRQGYYPFHLETNAQDYQFKLITILETVMQSDLTSIHGYTLEANRKIRRLLGVIAESAPLSPNFSAISRKTNIKRELIYKYIDHLERAKIINSLYKRSKGTASLQKPEKLYLNNSNLSFALQSNPDQGNIRESFVLNQLKNAKINVQWPTQGDFLLPDYNLFIEVGGRNKQHKQLKNKDNKVIAKDDIITSHQETIPLWLLGFLY